MIRTRSTRVLICAYISNGHFSFIKKKSQITQHTERASAAVTSSASLLPKLGFHFLLLHPPQQ